MTPQEALSILDQASALAVLSRIDHKKVFEAVEVLKKAIEPKKEEIKE